MEAHSAFPSNPAIERRVVAGCVSHPHDYLHAFADLTPDDFYSQPLRQIFEKAVAFHRNGRQPDPVLVGSTFVDPEMRNMVAGLEYPGELKDEWVVQLRQLTVARRCVEAAMRIAAEGADCQTDPEAFAESASRKLATALNGRTGSAKMRDMREVVRSAWQAVIDREAGKVETFVPSGFASLDDQLGGWENGRLYVIAARPGVGKTALAMQCAAHAARKKHTTVVYSLEMKPEESVYRFAAAAARTDSRNIQRGHMTRPQNAAALACMTELAELPLLFPDCIDASIDQIRRDARLQKHKGGLRMLVVDYLQLVQPGRVVDRGDQNVRQVSRGLKQMALELNIPVIALSQLNRESVKRADARPRLEDLRESGAIEEDADAVLLMHRAQNAQTRCDVIVAKNRAGPTGVVTLEFVPQYTQFLDMKS